MTTAEYLEDLFGLHGQVAVVIGGAGELGGALCEGIMRAGAHMSSWLISPRKPARDVSKSSNSLETG